MAICKAFCTFGMNVLRIVARFLDGQGAERTQ